MQTSLQTQSFKVGDVFTSKKIKDLPPGVSCPYFQLEKLEGINCDDYFGDTEKEFKITSTGIDKRFGNVYYLKETSGSKVEYLYQLLSYNPL